MGMYKVELYLDGYESEQEAYEDGFELIYEALNSAGTSVKVSEYHKKQAVRLTRKQLDKLTKYLDENPQATCIDVSQFTTGIGLATDAQHRNLRGDILEEFDITDYESW